MAGIRAKRTKDKITYAYTGSLEETLEKAKKELREKEDTTQWLFLKWQYDNAKKALDTYNRRVADLKGFIELAEKEIAKEDTKTDKR